MKKSCACGDVKVDPAFLRQAVADMTDSYRDGQMINHVDGLNLPRRQEILAIQDKLLELLFPGYNDLFACNSGAFAYSIGMLLGEVYIELFDQIRRAYGYRARGEAVREGAAEDDRCARCDIAGRSEQAVRALISALPGIRATLKKDVEAAYAGDPAALSVEEVVLSYPCIKTIAIQRLAHVLYQHKVPFIPRMMTEHAHSLTGIDINPGATLGEGIFIDHGTGVVIGETAVIGNSVRIYQGVTLGALSFPKDACGMLVKGLKRHPTIEDNVTIYAGATVLGDVVIGANSVIGGNVWLTESLPPGTKITMARPQQNVKYSK